MSSEQLAAHARSLEESYRKATEGNTEEALRPVLLTVSSAVGEVDGASLTSLAPTPHSIATTGGLAKIWDDVQFAAGAGPCLAAAEGGHRIIIESPDSDTGRQFADILARAGVEAMVAWPLPRSQRTLNVVARRARRFETDALEWIAIYATVAASALTIIDLRAEHEKEARVAAQLQVALESRVVVEQAKGILMAQRRIPAREAFRLLAQASQRANIGIRQMAERMIEGVTK